jgi:hydrogenase nickel incorporation protein HypA/HybF
MDNLDDEVSESIHFIPEVAHSYLKCPKCGSSDFEFMKGRGVWLASIKGGR